MFEEGKTGRCFSKDNTRNFKHGLCYSSLHRIWSGAKSRCYGINHPKYKLYGGRGINMCEEWKNDFKAFYDWAIANGWEDKPVKGINSLSLDRINVNGNYEPSNCRWATVKEQQNNRRDNVSIELMGILAKNKQWFLNNKWSLRKIGGIIGKSPSVVLDYIKRGEAYV